MSTHKISLFWIPHLNNWLESLSIYFWSYRRTTLLVPLCGNVTFSKLFNRVCLQQQIRRRRQEASTHCYRHSSQIFDILFNVAAHQTSLFTHTHAGWQIGLSQCFYSYIWNNSLNIRRTFLYGPCFVPYLKNRLKITTYIIVLFLEGFFNHFIAAWEG